MKRYRVVIKNIIIICLCLILLLVVYSIYYAQYAHKLPYIESHTTYSFIYDKNKFNNLDRKEIRIKLEKIVDVRCYIYTEKNMDITREGYTIPIFRHIYINRNLNKIDYIYSLCHELCHLKFNVGNERFTNFETFKYLYNSEFKEVAYYMIENLQQGYYIKDYDCLGYIEKYLNKN